MKDKELEEVLIGDRPENPLPQILYVILLWGGITITLVSALFGHGIFRPGFRKLITQSDELETKLVPEKMNLVSFGKVEKEDSMGVSIPVNVTNYIALDGNGVKYKLFLNDDHADKLMEQMKTGTVSVYRYQSVIVYPDHALTLGLISKTINNPISPYYYGFLFSLSAFKGAYHAKTPEPVEEENSFDKYIIYFLPFMFFVKYYYQKRRRKIFFRNFKQEHLENAKYCTVTFLKPSLFSRFKPGKTQMFSIQEVKNAFVFVKDAKKKEYKGFYLKYEDQYYFLPQEVVMNRKAS